MVNILSKKYYDRTKPFFSINTYLTIIISVNKQQYRMGSRPLNLNRISSLKDFFLFIFIIYGVIILSIL